MRVKGKRSRLAGYLFFLIGAFMLVWFIWFKDGEISSNIMPNFKNFSTLEIPSTATPFILWKDNLTGASTRMEIYGKGGDVLGIGVLNNDDKAKEKKQGTLWQGIAVPDTSSPFSKNGNRNKIFSNKLDKINSSTKIIELKDYKVIRSRFNFFYDPYDHPVLKTLREREKLDEVIAGEKDEFSKFVKLMHWVCKEVVGGDPDPYPPWNAVIILDMIRAGKTKGFCAQRAQVLLQILLSLGYQARYACPENHVALEAWSNQYKKWILLDPYLDVYYKHNNVPLNAWEIYKLVKAGKMNYIKVIGNMTAEQIPSQLSLYNKFDIYLKNNHLSEPQSAAKDLEDFWKFGVKIIDEHTKESPFKDGKICLITSNINDLYFNLNVVEIKKVILVSNSICRVFFDTFTPEFDSYLVMTDGDDDWVETSNNQFKWILRGGRNQLKVRVRNKAGILGQISSMVLENN